MRTKTYRLVSYMQLITNLSIDCADFQNSKLAPGLPREKTDSAGVQYITTSVFYVIRSEAYLQV